MSLLDQDDTGKELGVVWECPWEMPIPWGVRDGGHGLPSHKPLECPWEMPMSWGVRDDGHGLPSHKPLDVSDSGSKD